MKLTNKKKIIFGVSGLVFIIALTVGITVFAGRKDEENKNVYTNAEEKEYEVLCPVSENALTDVYCIAGRISSIDNKRIGIIVNNKCASKYMAESLKKHIEKDYEKASGSIFYVQENQDLSEENIDSEFYIWLDRVDAVVLLTGDCITSTKMLIYNAAFLEGRGIPTVTLCNESYKECAIEEKDNKLIPSLRVIYNDIPKECNDEELIEKKITQYMENIENKLIKAVSESEKNKCLVSEGNDNSAFTGTYSQIELFFYQNGWTDGLPIVLPTSEAVDEMLRGTDKASNICIGNMKPAGKNVMVEDIAINAVMAGCRPIDFPIILAVVEGLLNSESAYEQIITSLSSCSPLITVSGTIQDSLELNNGNNSYGTGNSSNATIGRAISLIIRNIGGLETQVEDTGIYGNSADYIGVIGEYYLGKMGLFNWERIDEQADKEMGENMISLSFENSYKYYDIINTDGKTIADSIIDTMADIDTNMISIVITTSMVNKMDEAGYTSDILLNSMLFNLSQNNPELIIDDIGIIVVEGEDTEGMLVINCTNGAGSRVFQNIELPKEWNQLLGEYTYNRYIEDNTEKNNGNVGALDAKDEKLGEIFYTEDIVDNKKYYLREQTDGLPVVVATKDRVNEMLKGTDYNKDKVLGKINEKNITVEMVAVNAVMSGAIPTYMPVIIAAVESLCNEHSEIMGALNEKSSVDIVINVSKNIAESLNMTEDSDLLSAGNKANAVIGRAVNLIIKNVADCSRNDTYGNPGQLSVILAKNSNVNIEGWSDTDEEDNVVITYADSAIYQPMPGLSTDDIILGITKAVNKFKTGMITIIITSKQANLLSTAGYTKDSFIEYIIANIEDSKAPLTKDLIDILIIENDNITGIMLMSSKITPTDRILANVMFPKQWSDISKKYVSYMNIYKQTPEKIEIIKNPNKMTYIANVEKFDPEGIEVKAIYSNGAEALIKNDELTYSVNEKFILTDSVEEVSYKGLTTTLEIDVISRVIEKLVVSKLPTKMDYKKGDKFEPEGMHVTAVYNCGYTYVLDESKYEITSDFNNSNKVTISCDGVKTIMYVNLDKKEAENKFVENEITSFDASLSKNGSVNLKVKMLNSENCMYKYLICNSDWNLYTPGVDTEGNALGSSDSIETLDNVTHSMQWYERHINDESYYNVLCDFIDKDEYQFEMEDNTTKYVFVLVQDNSGNTYIATDIVKGEEETVEVNTDGTYTVKVKQYEGSLMVPYLYSWNNAQNPTNGLWPGTAMIRDEELGDGWYKTVISAPEGIYNFIITNATGSMQTSDMTNNTTDVWAIINKANLSVDTNCVTLYDENVTVNNNEVKIHIKIFSDTSNIPYVYAWKSNMQRLSGDWPGVAAKKDKELGANWYTATIVPDGDYNFILTNAIGDEQTMDITNMNGEIWAVVTQSKLNKNGNCIKIYKDKSEIIEDNTIYLRQADNNNEIPYIYAEKNGSNLTGGKPGSQMQRYYELDGKWYTMDINSNSAYEMTIFNKLGTNKSDVIYMEPGDMEILVNTFDENAEKTFDNDTAYKDIEVIKYE